MIFDKQRVLVVAPHPDDETLGVAGTIKKFINFHNNVSVLFVSAHLPPLYDKKSGETTIKESKKAMNILGVNSYHYLNIPATKINELEIYKLNQIIGNYFLKIKPSIVFLPFPDRHIDHKLVFESCMVLSRPVGKNYPKIVLTYETLSETSWNAPGIEPSFNPELFIDISDTIIDKRKALSCYKSQISKNFSRNIDACNSLAKFRGSQNNCKYAEAFKVVRMIF